MKLLFQEVRFRPGSGPVQAGDPIPELQIETLLIDVSSRAVRVPTLKKEPDVKV